MQRLLALFAVAALAISGLFAVPAYAAGANAEAEIRKIFIHSVDRSASQAEVANFLGLTKRHCTWGISDTAFRMTTSQEARNRWGNAQNLAGMLYAALLRRAPDNTGLRTYTNAIRTYGLAWSSRQMMGSIEYRTRLANLCGTGQQGLSAAMFDWQTAMDFAVLMTERAKGLAAGCAAVKGLQKVTSFKENARKVRFFIGVTGEVTKKLHGKLDGTCSAVLQYLKAAIHIAMIVQEGGDGHNPVFIQTQSHKSWLTGRMIRYFTVRVGSNPTSWTEYKGKFVD